MLIFLPALTLEPDVVGRSAPNPVPRNRRATWPVMPPCWRRLPDRMRAG